ncbi:MBOAT family protein [Candidatus Peribacteria bacterium]|nr:MBOAT family protein [Candidatus Peribacteria bacterium]
MLFGSDIFLLWFLPITLASYFLCPGKYRNLLLLIASYLFYAWWDVASLGLMIVATVINYVAGIFISRARDTSSKYWLLTAVIVIDVLILCFFKYERMLATTINDAAGHGLIPILNVILPIGISFYLFEAISYCVECARGGSRAKSFVEFACYLSLFPHVLAGPIIRFSQIDDQLRTRKHSFLLGAEGGYRFLLGLSKKILIADSVAMVADSAFAATPSSSLLAWMGIAAYTLQIYFDFSGYSDMAIGLGLMFGFRFPENFNLPYFSISITEFWRRWHMTLSSWFRDYVYIGLGGNRGGTFRTLRNLFLTMLLAGWWHGANWTFVVWGGYYGALLCIERLLHPSGVLERLPTALRRLLTLFLVMMGWVLFRSQTFTQAMAYYAALFSFTPGSVLSHRFALITVVVGIIAACVEYYVPQKPRYSLSLVFQSCVLFLLCLIVIFGDNASPFIYFQF